MRIRASIVNSIASSSLIHFRIRTLFMRAMGFDIALRSQLFPHVYFASNKFHLGSRSTINVGTIIDNGEAEVWIGERVGIGVGVRLVTSGHAYDNPSVRAGEGKHSPICVGDGSWVGAGATILQGVTIGNGAVVAAGAVVTRDVPRNTLVMGIPARVVRDLSTEVR